MKLKTLTTGAAVVTTVESTWVPSVIHWDAATQLTNFKMNVLGDGNIVDLDAAGLSVLNRAFREYTIEGKTCLPLADGLIPSKNVDYTFTNSAAQTPSVYVYSQNKASFYIKHHTQKVFAGSGQEISNFVVLGLPNFVDADSLDIEYNNGTIQKMSPEDLRIINSFDQSIQDDVNDLYISNAQGNIKKVVFIPNADQAVYLSKTQSLR